MEDLIQQAATSIAHSQQAIALTGAGISVESGIPDFRSAGGLWERFDPMEYGTIAAFQRNPEKVWGMLLEMANLIRQARPNPAHLSLARLEQLGRLRAVITQNVDGLHQKAGSARVIEFHGSSATLSCLDCGNKYHDHQVPPDQVPRCSCGSVLKPDVVFFGEPIPARALDESYRLGSSCDVLLVVGTSAEVAPANAIPLKAKANGATIIEVNLEPTALSREVSNIFLQGRAGTILPELLRAVEAIAGD